MTEENSRAEFEQFAAREYGVTTLRRSPTRPDRYVDMYLQRYWEVWKAARMPGVNGESDSLQMRVISPQEHREKWMGDPPFGGFERYVENHGTPLILSERNHEMTASTKEIVLTEADALADLNGTPRPDNPTVVPVQRCTDSLVGRLRELDVAGYR